MTKNEMLKALEVSLDAFRQKMPTKEEYDELYASVDRHGLSMQKMNYGTPISASSNIERLVNDNADTIKGLSKVKGQETQLFVIKADNTTTGSIANNTTSFSVPDIGQLQFQTPSIASLFREVVLPPDRGGKVTYADWDSDTSVRAATMVAEGTLFPESTANWVESSLELKKIGDSIPASEELLYDAKRFADELNGFISNNVKLVEDIQIYSGDNTGLNMAGLLQYASEFVPVGSGITLPNVADLILKMVESISTASNYKPDFVLMNMADFTNQMLIKTTEGEYIPAPWFDATSMRVAGLSIVLTSTVTADTLLIGERGRGTLYTDGGITVSAGYVEAQFVEDLITLKAKRRENLLIKQRDKGAFSKCSGIQAALTAIGAAPTVANVTAKKK